MTVHQPSLRPQNSMWAAIQSADQLLPGIWSVSTAGHGGFILSEERQEAMPDTLRSNGRQYEEDCEWALVVLAFEQEFQSASRLSDAHIRTARDSVKCWNPDKYTAFTGEAVAENESHVLRDRKAYAEKIGKCCLTSAWGSWADWVPEGKVGVSGMTVESVSHLGRPQYTGETVYALADKASYDKRDTAACFDDMVLEIIPQPEELRR